ncbi:hypothetical protein IPZ58_07835 [Streptomyces roseoverticillatus]|uniref:hypothetical protein n=1 Tax=Streptomyces roseoverticillatus TaxID=66429 RepID=UPI001F406884|nr:hypothetical protein [Streptomyces roseoverticillatus]MCF3101489.1 hypothetical protein [Streptomyces roseoverticillatus]
MNRDGDRQPVTGPLRIYVDATPLGVELDVSHMIGKLLVQLAADFEEDPDGVGYILTSIAEAERVACGPDSHATHERDDLVERLLESIGGGAVPVHGPQVLRLAERLRVLGMPKGVPHQREGGEAA